ncbi:hypothetical protein N2600_17320 [Rhizobium sp. WSM1274]|uniref:hypothetical protein n=1 Tax=Rhizobium TaxID=379 RepID=UPI001FEE46C7|nr:hypothetical protein N2600_17320 [Rhizobium leguminosarum bv. viciae]
MALLYGCMELLDKVSSRNGSGEDGPSEALTRREIERLRRWLIPLMGIDLRNQPAIQSATASFARLKRRAAL